MSRTYRTGSLLAASLALALTLTGCIKSTTFNPYAPPDTDELDRLQEQVNASADLEPTRAVINELETQIRAAIAKHAPQTRLGTFGLNQTLQSCQEPYTWAVGQQYTPAPLSGRPAADIPQWQHIADELKPVFANAGFQPSKEQPVDGMSYGNGSAFVTLTNGGKSSPLMFEASTGCRLPTAWRTSPPPPYTATGELTVHYPYLFGGAGGRTRVPG